jgi:hypothetical protein
MERRFVASISVIVGLNSGFYILSINAISKNNPKGYFRMLNAGQKSAEQAVLHLPCTGRAAQVSRKFHGISSLSFVQCWPLDAESFRHGSTPWPPAARKVWSGGLARGF